MQPDQPPPVVPSAAALPQVPPVQAPAAPIPAPSAAPNTSPPKTDGSNKMWFILIAVIVLILLAGGGVLYYLNTQSSKPTPVTTDQTNTPETSLVDDLNQDLNSINESSDEAGFQSADQDLNSL